MGACGWIFETLARARASSEDDGGEQGADNHQRHEQPHPSALRTIHCSTACLVTPHSSAMRCSVQP